MTIQKSDLAAVYTLKSTPDLLNYIIKSFEEPVDSYWNGSHTWFDEVEGVMIEWRLHPVQAFEMPQASRPEELINLALEGTVDPTHYWEGLEVFPTEDHSFTQVQFSNYCESKLSLKPDEVGFVDHENIGNKYEHSGGKVSIVQLLLEQIDKSF